MTITKNNSTIYNEGTFESEPVIKVYGSGDIKLKTNDDDVTVKKVDGYVAIDSVLNDAYKDEVLKNGDMIGEFPIFRVEENVVGFSGNVSNEISGQAPPDLCRSILKINNFKWIAKLK